MGWQLASDQQLTLWLLGALVVLMSLDVLTGWLTAIVLQQASSRVSWEGVSRKCITLVVVLTVAIVNTLAPAPLNQLPMTLPVLVGYLGSELYSILENAKRAGVLSPVLGAFLAQQSPKESDSAVRLRARPGPRSGSSGGPVDLVGDASQGVASSSGVGRE